MVAKLLNARYYEKDGEIPYQMYYEGLGDFWPRTRWRRRLWTVLRPINSLVVEGRVRKRLSRSYPYEATEEWGGGGSGRGSRLAGCWHLPCAVRVNTGHWMHTRFAVPVEDEMCRLIFFNTRRTRWIGTRMVLRIWFVALFRWLHFYNFSGQDSWVAQPCRYGAPETLAPTDSHLVQLRDLLVHGSRDARRAQGETPPAAPESSGGGGAATRTSRAEVPSAGASR